jgi:hypothetical protein
MPLGEFRNRSYEGKSLKQKNKNKRNIFLKKGGTKEGGPPQEKDGIIKKFFHVQQGEPWL